VDGVLEDVALLPGHSRMLRGREDVEHFGAGSGRPDAPEVGAQARQNA
jgi:hypothetical protein